MNDVDLLADLNEPQREAVTHAGSPVLVVAGAGSGKTRVLTRRIAYLISQRGAHPGSILAITFTNKAAAEMRSRVVELVGPRARSMWVSTFHSACVRILRAEIQRFGISRSFSIYDDTDSKRLVTLVMKDQNLDPKRFKPSTILNWISGCKNELVDFAEAETTATRGNEKIYAEVYREYQRRLGAANALDFDDLIMTTVQLFRGFPDLREAYRRRFRHVLVDEYQDTNHAQYALIRELCGGARTSFGDPGFPSGPGIAIDPPELMVVGDSDQSIYAFRGATIRNILEFQDDFPGARTIVLEQNYRSTQNILTAANQVITRNPKRPAKRLWSDAGDGELIVGYVADTEHDEAHFVAEEISRLADEGLSRPGDTAVFYRTNAQSRAFEEVFIRVGMPYQVVGGVRFYERKEIRDAIAYLRAIANPADDVSVRRILNVPTRGIGEKAETQVDGFARLAGISYFEALRQAEQIPELATRSVNQIRGFVKLIETEQALMESGTPADEILTSILQESGYLDMLKASKDPQDESRLENLVELVSVAAEFVAAAHTVDLPADGLAMAAPEPDDSLPAFLERIALVADSDQLTSAEEGRVTLMTLHTAKGLEYDTVFLTGFEDGIFPHSRALLEPDELEEERRLAYVGITRARKRLYLTRAIQRMMWGTPTHNPESRFIAEVPGHLMDWRRVGVENTGWQAAAEQRRRSSWQQTGGSRSTRDAGPAYGGGSSVLPKRRRLASVEVGDRVLHDKFGLGKVVATAGSGDQATADVDFGSAGTKRLALAHAPLEKL
jgi:DNA helicase-2/ATP-dependent DNA helicase PcrA